MIQLIGGILFILPIILIIQSLRTGTLLKRLPDILMTLGNGVLLSILTILALVMWSWGGDKTILGNYILYSAAGTGAVILTSIALTKLIVWIKHNSLAIAWYLPVIQLLLSNLIVVTFIILIPLFLTQQEKHRQQNISKLSRTSDRVIVDSITYDNTNITARFSLLDMPQGSYTLASTINISPDTYTISKEACELEQLTSFTETDEHVNVTIPLTFLTSCLNKAKITSDNAIINGLILTIHPRLRKSYTETQLSPVAVGKWIDITVTKSSIVLKNMEGQSKTIGW